MDKRNDGSVENVAAIKQVAIVSGWRPCADPMPCEHDIILMDGVDGRHVGVMVAANGALLVLHCLDRVGVCVQPLSDLSRMGFHGFEFWRRA